MYLLQLLLMDLLKSAEWRIQRDVDSDNNRKYATATIIAAQPYVSTPLLTDQTLIIRECSNYSIRCV
jgi:hypothetical protein